MFFIIISYKLIVKNRETFKYELVRVEGESGIYDALQKLMDYNRELKLSTTDYNIINLNDLCSEHGLTIKD
jgi:hypothetical protein